MRRHRATSCVRHAVGHCVAKPTNDPSLPAALQKLSMIAGTLMAPYPLDPIRMVYSQYRLKGPR